MHDSASSIHLTRVVVDPGSSRTHLEIEYCNFAWKMKFKEMQVTNTVISGGNTFSKLLMRFMIDSGAFSATRSHINFYNNFLP